MGFLLNQPSTSTLLLLALSASCVVANGPLGTTQPPPEFSDIPTCAISIPGQDMQFLSAGLTKTFISDDSKRCFAYNCASVPGPFPPTATQLNSKDCGSQCVDPTSVFNNVCQCRTCPSGSNAQANPCELIPNACRNGGTCKGDSNTGEITCTCPPSFFGSNCDLDYCGSSPCQNGGSCVPDASVQTTGYRCDCTPSYTDRFCQTDKCNVPPCYYGTCALTSTLPGFMCQCIAGYTGALCDTQV